MKIKLTKEMQRHLECIRVLEASRSYDTGGTERTAQDLAAWAIEQRAESLLSEKATALGRERAAEWLVARGAEFNPTIPF